MQLILRSCSYCLHGRYKDCISMYHKLQKCIFKSTVYGIYLYSVPVHSEFFGLFLFGNWKFENLPISILLSIILLFIPYIFIIQSKKNYRLCKTLKKIVLKSGENCFFATFSIFSLVSQGTNLVKTHIVATFCRKY